MENFLRKKFVFEIRISTWNTDYVIENIFHKKDSYIIALETGKINNNEHIHIALSDEYKRDTLKKKLQKHFSKKYKLSEIRDEERYLCYIAKENNWITNTNLTSEHYNEIYKEKYQHANEVAKIQSKNLRNLMIKLYNDYKDKAFIGNREDRINIIMSHKHIYGLAPHKAVFRQVFNTLSIHKNGPESIDDYFCDPDMR